MLTRIGRFLLSLTVLLFAVAVHAQVPTASISCPATALVGEPVICSGTGSTNVNGQIGWSTQTFVDGTAPVAWNFGDNAGPYSKAEILKATHVYLAAGTYTISLTVKNSGGVSASNTTTITISDIPAATSGNIQTLSDRGTEADNRTALQNAINTAMAANTAPQKIRLPNITYVGPFSFPAAAGTQYVTIEPIDTSWLPGPLKRVTSALAGNMPKIKSPGPDQVQMAIDGAGRGYVRFLGVEFNKTSGGHLYQLVQIGGDSPSTFGALPSHIIFDRCYLHGETFDDLDHGIYVQGNYVSVLNSYIKDAHDTGADSQAVFIGAGVGFAFVNNYAEAYGENIMWGGADTSVRYSSTCSAPTTTSCTLSSTTDLTVGTPISFALAGGTTAGTGFSTTSATGQVADGTPLAQWDQVSLTDGTVVGIVQSVNTATSPDTITLTTSTQFPGARVNVAAGVTLLRRNANTASIVRSISGSTITYDAISAAPNTTTNAVKYGATPQDAFVWRNYFYKDRFYREGDALYNGSYRPVVKNSIEFKHLMRAVVGGNYFENHWGGQGQGGPSVLFTPRNQSNTNPWVVSRDIQSSDNRLIHMADGVNIQGTDVADVSGSSGYVQYVVIRNTLWEDLSSSWNGDGMVLLFANGSKHCRLIHNTVINTGNKLVLGTTGGASDLLILNNIGEYRNYGFFGDGGSQGDGAIAAYMSDGYFRYNVMSDDISGLDGTSWTAPRGAPNYFPATIDTNTFVDRPNGDYHLKNTSPYKAGGATPAADGTDMGVNFNDVTTATTNTISGDWSGGAVGGGDFVTDTFTEASDTTLASHTGEVGATWTLHPSYSGAALDNGSLKRIYLNTSAAAAYYASGVPPGANYCVQADFNRVTQISNNISIIIGMDTAADAGLLLRGNDNGTTFQWEVIDRAGGANTLLTSSSANQPAIGGAAITMKMCRNGTSVTVFANGVQDTALNATTTTTAVGKAGIRAVGQATSTTGLHLDNFHAQ
jgi:PKD repeat protein